MLDWVDVATPPGMRAAGRGGLGVLLHGFGASAQDLVPLAAELGGVERWVVPHAPFPLVVAGMHYGRAWFPSAAHEMELALYGGYFRNLRQLEPSELAGAVEAVEALLSQRLGDGEPLVIGGFSQGAIVAAELLRRRIAADTTPPALTMLFSGSLIAERLWLATNDAAIPAAVVQSHGRYDAILTYDEGLALRDALVSLGCDVRFESFDGGHEIPNAAIDAAREELARIH